MPKFILPRSMAEVAHHTDRTVAWLLSIDLAILRFPYIIPELGLEFCARMIRLFNK